LGASDHGMSFKSRSRLISQRRVNSKEIGWW